MYRRLLVLLPAALLASTALRIARAQTPPQPAPPPTGNGPFSPEQLDQMLAPIALYPDALLSQMLMASTYPLEVVEAARWTGDNPNLHGNDAVNAVANNDWDVSVKSLVGFPQVLGQMNAHLDWTQKLGDAELAQPQDVADSIQRLRSEAAAAGNLQSGPQYVVSTEGTGDDIQYVIAPANPDVIYVPYYSPLWVYGRWRWAGYPPFYWSPLAAWGYGPNLATGFMWGVGLSVSIALFGGWSWRRGQSFINVNYQRARVIDHRFDPARYANNVWTHDPVHRRGVVYRTPQETERFQQAARTGVDQRQPYRGHVVEPEAAHVEAATHVNPPPAQPHPVVNQPMHTVPGSQSTNALSGVSRGPAVERESQRGQQQQVRVVQHAPPPPPPPPRPAPPPPQPAKKK